MILIWAAASESFSRAIRKKTGGVRESASAGSQVRLR